MPTFCTITGQAHLQPNAPSFVKTAVGPPQSQRLATTVKCCVASLGGIPTSLCWHHSGRGGGGLISAWHLWHSVLLPAEKSVCLPSLPAKNASPCKHMCHIPSPCLSPGVLNSPCMIICISLPRASHKQCVRCTSLISVSESVTSESKLHGGVCVYTVSCTCVCAGLGTCCGSDYNSQQQLNRAQPVRRRTRRMVGFRRFRRNMIYVSKSISTRVPLLSFHSWKWLRSVILKPNRLSDINKQEKKHEYIKQTRQHHALMSTRKGGSSERWAYVQRFYITDKVTLWNNHN